MIPFPVGDVLDRYSILCLKLEFTAECLEEHSVFKAEYERLSLYWESQGVTLKPYFEELLAINRSIWQLETKIRCGKEECGDWKSLRKEEVPSQMALSSLIDIGINALNIRDFNRERKAVMCKIVAVTGEGWKDIKVNHSSC